MVATIRIKKVAGVLLSKSSEAIITIVRIKRIGNASLFCHNFLIPLMIEVIQVAWKANLILNKMKVASLKNPDSAVTG